MEFKDPWSQHASLPEGDGHQEDIVFTRHRGTSHQRKGGSEDMKIASKLTEPASAMQSRYLVDNNAYVIIFQI